MLLLMNLSTSMTIQMILLLILMLLVMKMLMIGGSTHLLVQAGHSYLLWGSHSFILWTRKFRAEKFNMINIFWNFLLKFLISQNKRTRTLKTNVFHVVSLFTSFLQLYITFKRNIQNFHIRYLFAKFIISFSFLWKISLNWKLTHQSQEFHIHTFEIEVYFLQ